MSVDPVLPVTTVDFSSDRMQPGVTLKPAVSKKETLEATHGNLAELAQAIEPYNISLEFSKDDETGRIVVRMIDQRSGETLQQIPNQAMLHVAAVLSKLQGRIIDCKA